MNYTSDYKLKKKAEKLGRNSDLLPTTLRGAKLQRARERERGGEGGEKERAKEPGDMITEQYHLLTGSQNTVETTK